MRLAGGLAQTLCALTVSAGATIAAWPVKVLSRRGGRAALLVLLPDLLPSLLRCIARLGHD